MLIGLLLVLLVSILLGRYPQPGLISPAELSEDTLARQLTFNLRLPRLLAALLLGMTLAASGSVFQTIFGNPLVEPGFLGVSQGAAFGAAFSIILLSNAQWVVQLSATFFALAGLAASYLLARRVQFGGWVLRLVLSGIAVSAIFSAGLGLLKFMADPMRQLPEITFWLLGGLYSVTWQQLGSIAIIVILMLLLMYRFRWRLNLLSLDDETSFSLGIHPERERLFLLVIATTATALLVSISGMVGWVGLIMPHIARRLFGADTSYSLPGAMLLGGIFTVICDDMARVLTAGEIPLGIFTSLIGAIVFILLMMKKAVSVER